MANQEHLAILKQGVDAWNTWRKEHQDIQPDLSDIELRGISLEGADLREANLEHSYLKYKQLKNTSLSGAQLQEAYLRLAELENADLSGADLRAANFDSARLENANLSNARLRDAILRDTILRKADLSNADLSGADLSNADLSGADLTEANLHGANLFGATLIRTNLTRAILTNCIVYGASVWDAQLEGTIQLNLVITHSDQPTITVDNLKVAQFMYLLLNNAEIRGIIDTLTSKVVLILGRFTSERKAVLDALRDELRKQNYTPVLFDFEKPRSRDFTETVRTLAHLSRFIIADLTDPSSIPQELQAIVSTLVIPVLPLLQVSSKEYGMFEYFSRYPWVLEIYRYKDVDDLHSALTNNVIKPLEAKVHELETIIEG